MKSIQMIHGCAPSWRPHEQSLRNYVSEGSLKRHLVACREAYGPLSDFPAHDVLTIDDSTIGAARACLVAREAGHAVTLFINPAQIARRRLYWFSRLDAILDARTVATVAFAGRDYELRPGRPLQSFRLAVKARLVALDEGDTDAMLDELADRLGAGAAVLPEHARTMTLECLRELVDRGVQIGSHGWDHRDITSLGPAELVEDVRHAADWFQTCLGLVPRHYAVPYGLSFLPNYAAGEVSGMIMLANSELKLGSLDSRHWNRRDITTELQD
jgi:polysaccharide deacetylase